MATVDHPAGAAQAVIALDGDTSPHGPIYGLPLPEDGALRDDDGKYLGHGFPAIERFNELTGRLRYGLPVRLYDGDIVHVGPESARLRANTALVGAAVASDREPLFTGLWMQCSGLGDVFGTTPIAHYTSDGAFTGETTTYVSVHLDASADQSWTQDGVEVAAQWNPTLGLQGGRVHFEVSASPLISITDARPAPWSYWLDNWVVPVRDLVSLATGANRRVTRATVTIDTGDERRGAASATAFGRGISQQPFTVRPGQYDPPLFTFAELPCSFQDLTARWLAIRENLTGFVDAYLPIVRGEPQTPAAQVVLLAAASEALHTHRHGEGPRSQEEHRAQRQLVLDLAKRHLDAANAKFLRRHLARHDRFSLTDRITSLVSSCPNDLVDAGNLRALPEQFGEIRNDLSHGRRADPKAMLSAIRRLRLVLDCQLLVELGLSADRVRSRLRD